MRSSALDDVAPKSHGVVVLGSSESHPTDAPVLAQSANSVVLPNPAGVHTKINLWASPWSSRSISRERTKWSRRISGMLSLVARSSPWSAIASPAPVSAESSGGGWRPTWPQVIHAAAREDHQTQQQGQSDLDDALLGQGKPVVRDAE